ncbi:hypothetical protein [Terrilactibacillus laevilacticus]|uniref:Uncharacterized protein n=1 Tax=Terrilactibacillus laevilacticus TaxID=1380157 RepID=A0ABW5PQK7_9BACI|nr:hypothetical protein [Terrilactibacillus laevilacticus]
MLNEEYEELIALLEQELSNLTSLGLERLSELQDKYQNFDEKLNH